MMCFFSRANLVFDDKIEAVLLDVTVKAQISFKGTMKKKIFVSESLLFTNFYLYCACWDPSSESLQYIT